MSEGMFCWFVENAQNISLHSIYYNDIALCCVNSVTILLNVFASGLVVYKYYQTRARQPVSNTLLFLLASLDLAKSCVGQSLFISMFILEFVGIFYCTLQNINETVLCVFSGFSFIMVTIVLTSERFFAIVFPIYHRVYMRKKVLIYLTLSLFVVWAILSMTFYLILRQITQLCSVFLFNISFGLVYTLAVYVKIFSVSRKSTTWRDEEVKSRNSSLHNNGNREVPEMEPCETPSQKVPNKTCRIAKKFNFTAKEKRTIFRMLSIVGVLYLTCIPILAAFTYMAVTGTPDELFVNYLYPWGTTILFTSGVINPYIYCYRNEHFRIRKPAFKNAPVCSSDNMNGGFSDRSL